MRVITPKLPRYTTFDSDVNGALNILRKVTEQLSVALHQRLAKTIREALTLPKRIDIFATMKKSYRSRAVSSFQLE